MKPVRAMGDAQKMGQDMMAKLPKVDDVTFWLGINALTFLFVGAAQFYFGIGGLVYSSLAILMGLVYAYLAWARMKMHPAWMGMVSLYLPALIILVDVILTAVSTIYSLMIVAASVMLVYHSYMQHRGPM